VLRSVLRDHSINVSVLWRLDPFYPTKERLGHWPHREGQRTSFQGKREELNEPFKKTPLWAPCDHILLSYPHPSFREHQKKKRNWRGKAEREGDRGSRRLRQGINGKGRP